MRAMGKDKKKVLVVEDEVISAMNLANMLELWGYEVCPFATSGETAILIAEEEKPDIALLDIKLKGNMNGIELAREIKKQFSIPVIFMTGYANAGLKKEASALKPEAYLIKPFDLNELREVLDSASVP